MDIIWMKAFITVAECKSFSGAAEEMYLTQSVISKYIQKLESELGVLLFARDKHHVEITEVGKQILPEAYAMLRSYEKIRKTAETANSLHIGILPVADSYQFPQILAEYEKRHPETVLLLEEHQNVLLTNFLEGNVLDGVFCRVEAEESGGEEYVVFCRESLVALVPSWYRTGTEELLDVKDLENERMIFLGKETGLWQKSMALCKDAGFTPDICYTGSARGNITRLVKNGSGVALLAENVARECVEREPELKIVHLKQKAESRLVFCASEAGKKNPAMAALLDYLIEVTQINSEKHT